MTHQAGFSLLELMCVLAVISLLAYIGATPILALGQHNQDKSTLNMARQQLADALTQARQLAVVSGQASYVCGGTGCDGDWSSGISAHQTMASGDIVNPFLQHRFASSINMVWSGFPVQKTFIVFEHHGLSGYQNGTFEFCLGDLQADLVLNQNGRFYTTPLKQKEQEACQ
ncbi:GspH/FimT family pseudopilin [Marinomonas algarum]|uniref:Type II secretion system protein H n=1 Tax=Marinomonas algarum TaxID=2883105 RepID=A0A9X1ILY5_9GAMM|nr:GspH/FimT family pseudopilin [Marinomonas algarum]MCB5161342.1 GspH/FimT family pseudopilin [Marinomonas algarum]